MTSFYVTLQERGLIHVEGEDRREFLQGLISNDMVKLSSANILYACLLTPQGKFLHDFFVHDGGDFLLIDCEGGERAKDLYTRLNRYRLRSKVTLSVEENYPVFAVFGEPLGLPDPRHSQMGRRTFNPPDFEEKPFSEWDARRIRLGIPDGSRDMVVESSTLHEGRIDEWHGVDYHKGCYMGQELTARMHHRGLAKRHLYPVQIEGGCPAPMSDLMDGNTLLGQMRSSCGDIGLAPLKDDMVEKINGSNKIHLLG